MTQTPPAGLKHFKKVELKVFVSICHVPDWIVRALFLKKSN